MSNNNPSVSVSFQSSQFQQETKKMADSLKTVQKEFKLSDAALKLSGSNADRYANKIESLSKQIKLQSDIVEKSKKAVEQANKARESAAARVRKATEAYEDAAKAQGTSAEKLEKLKKEVELSSKAYTKAETRATKWNQKVIDGEAATKRLEYALKQTNDELENLRIEKVTKNFDALGDASDRIGKNLTRNVTVPLLAAGTAIYKFSTDLNSDLADIGTLGIDIERLKEIKPELQEIAILAGKNTSDISDGVYQVISAFGDTSDTMKITEINAKAAAAGMATTEESIKLTSLVTKGYGDISAEANQKVADLAFTTVKLGQTTFPEIAASAGNVVSASKALRISQEELFAVFATLTGVTGDASAVSTQYASVMTSLMKPSEAMQEALENLGYKSGFAAVEALGFSGTLNALVESVGGSEEKLVQLAGRKEAVTAMLALTGSQAETFAVKLDAMANSAGAAEEAFRKQTEGINESGFIMQQSIVRLQVATQNFGDTMAPSIEQVAVSVEKLTEWFEGLNDEQRETILKIGGLVAVIGPAVLVVGKLSLAIGATVKSYHAIKAATLAYKAANEATTTSVAILNGVMTANPALAVAAAIGVVVAAVAAYSLNADKAVNVTQELKKETDRLTEAYDNKLKAIEDDNKSHMAEVEIAERLTNELEDLSEKVDKTVDEKVRMSEIVDQLNAKIPDLALAINSETGELNKQISSIREATIAYKEMLLVKAGEKKATAAAETLLDLQEQKRLSEERVLELDKEKEGLNNSVKETYSPYGVETDGGNEYYDDKYKYSAVDTERQLLLTQIAELERGIESAEQDIQYAFDLAADYAKKYGSQGDDSNTGDDVTDPPSYSGSTTSSANEAIRKELQDLKFELDMRYISEEEYYERLEKLRDRYYKVGSTEWQNYTLALVRYDEQLYDERRANSDRWIEEQKRYGRLSSQEEIAAYERIKKYTQEYYDKGIISYEEYVTQIRDLDKEIFDTRKSLIEEAVSAEFDLQKAALDARKEALEDEEQSIKDSYDARIQAVEDYYDGIELAEKQEERAAELSELMKQEEKYRNAATRTGQEKLADIREEIAELQKEAAEEERDLERQEKIDKITKERDSLEEDRLRRLEALDREYQILESAQETFLENIGKYATTTAETIENVTSKIQTMLSVISSLGIAVKNPSGIFSGGNTINVNDYGDKNINSKDETIDYTSELFDAAENAARTWGLKIE